MSAVSANGEAVGQRIARFLYENLADLLVMGAPSSPIQADFKLHSKAIDVIVKAGWAVLISA